MEDRLIKLEEVAFMVGVSTKTINTWYAFKKKYPDNEYSQMLPAFERIGTNSTRYWHLANIYKLKEFKDIIPKGRNGILGEITHKRKE